MSKEIPYEEQTLNHPNLIARFAHQARYRNSLSLVVKALPPDGTILDFGAGQGEFLHRLGGLRPDARLLAFEPFMKLKYPEIAIRSNMNEFENGSIDVLCAFETLEHISNQEIDAFVRQTLRVCRPDARIIVSVPIMQGASLPIKQAVRSILFRRFSDYSFAEILRGIFGMKVDRTTDILLSHKGFDHRSLYDRLNAELAMLETFCSPFRYLPWWCNSQAFFVFAPRTR